MAIVALPPFALALICFFALTFASGCVAAAVSFLYRRKARMCNSPVVDVESIPRVSLCDSSTAKMQDSAAVADSDDLAAELFPDSSVSHHTLLDAVSDKGLLVSRSKFPGDIKATTTTGATRNIQEQDRYTTIPRRSFALAQAKAKARGRQTLSILSGSRL